MYREISVGVISKEESINLDANYGQFKRKGASFWAFKVQTS